MTVGEATFTSDSALRERDVVAALAERFGPGREERIRTRRTYYDTFDGRLYRRGEALVAEGRRGRRPLRWHLPGGGARYRATVDRIPAFARDLPPGAFRRALEAITDVRRLLPLARVDVNGRSIAVLDRRGKTVARVFVERGTAAAASASSTSAMAERLRVQPIVGYERAHDEVLALLGRRFSLERREGGELRLAVETLGVDPAGYSSKLRLRLRPDARTDRAVKTILQRLLATLRANEDGTRRDLDPEFLHDFRVAIRRTRSCLSQLPGVLDPVAVERFAGEFTWLGRITGPTRDLDVHLLELPGYRDELPESIRGDLDDLERYLLGRQRREQARVARALRSRRYRALLDDWARFVGAPCPEDPPADTPNAQRPVREVAGKRIRRTFRQVVKRSRGIGPDTPVATVHRIRISCKKLRYLLEFFASVFDRNRVKLLVSSLKRLQDDLGDFNDADVQQRALTEVAEALGADGSAGPRTVLAMGRIVEQLHERQENLHERIVEGVRALVDEAHRKLFDEVFR